jgi:O-acetyl-ADP-ribose deacetylase
MRLKLVQQDITTLDVDAIVNAANNSLLGGGGVDGAIHAAAGPELLPACKALNGCATGEAKITPGFQLAAKWIIHTVGPVWIDGKSHEQELLQRCYTRCLQLATQHNISSIAFPAISCGLYGYPIQQATTIAVNCVKTYANPDSKIKEVYFVCFSADVFQAYTHLTEQ